MYNVIFENTNGQKYVFGKNGNTVSDMDFGNGVSVNIGTSQGFLQIGETVENRTVSGRTITVKGAVYGNIPERKQTMRKILSPFAYGKLIFENKYYTRVYVKDAPSFSPVKNSGRFSMRFFAPFPFFYSVETYNFLIGGVKPLFTFPVNYAIPHKFGEKSEAKYSAINNNGDVSIPFDLFLQSTGSSSNIVLSNLKTSDFLKINGTLSAGESLHIYRNEKGVLKSELTSDGIVEDAISRIDETSTLFELEVGDNLIFVDDDEGGVSLTARINYSPAVVAVYET